MVIHFGSSAISIREQSSSNGGLTSIAQSFSPNGPPSLQHKFHSVHWRWNIWIKWDERLQFPEKGSFKVRWPDNWIELNGRSLESRNWAKSAPSFQSGWRVAQIHSKSNTFLFPSRNFQLVAWKQSLHVTKLTVSEFSEHGTKGVSVGGGRVCQGKGEREGMSREGKGGPGGKAFSGWPNLDWRQLFGDLL